MGVVIVEAEGADLRVNLGRPTVTNGDFATLGRTCYLISSDLVSFDFITDHVSMGRNAIASVRLSVCLSVCLSVRPFPLYLTFGLDLCMCVGHYSGSQGIETEGHRSRLGRSYRHYKSHTYTIIMTICL